MPITPANTVLTLSQSSLQDYVDCPRRFQLRYLQRLAWPALEAEPALEFEKQLQLGTIYHRLIQQHQVGIPSDHLSATIDDETLQLWWQNYISHAQTLGDVLGVPGLRYPEIILSADLEGHHLIAKYDLLVTHPGQKATIIDWKTSLKRPARQWLADRLQTRLYPYLLVRAGAHLNNGKVWLPGEVELVYWFANYPAEPVRFQYRPQSFKEDEQYLASLIREISLRQEDTFPLTSQEVHCRYCTYHSLCERGSKAGSLQELGVAGEEDQFDLFIDFEQIPEIEF